MATGVLDGLGGNIHPEDFTGILAEKSRPVTRPAGGVEHLLPAGEPAGKQIAGAMFVEHVHIALSWNDPLTGEFHDFPPPAVSQQATESVTAFLQIKR